MAATLDRQMGAVRNLMRPKMPCESMIRGASLRAGACCQSSRVGRDVDRMCHADRVNSAVVQTAAEGG